MQTAQATSLVATAKKVQQPLLYQAILGHTEDDNNCGLEKAKTLSVVKPSESRSTARRLIIRRHLSIQVQPEGKELIQAAGHKSSCCDKAIDQVSIPTASNSRSTRQSNGRHSVDINTHIGVSTRRTTALSLVRGRPTIEIKAGYLPKKLVDLLSPSSSFGSPFLESAKHHGLMTASFCKTPAQSSDPRVVRLSLRSKISCPPVTFSNIHWKLHKKPLYPM